MLAQMKESSSQYQPDTEIVNVTQALQVNSRGHQSEHLGAADNPLLTKEWESFTFMTKKSCATKIKNGQGHLQLDESWDNGRAWS